MCGRYTLRSHHRFRFNNVRSLDLPIEARYNIAPSQKVLVVADFGRGLESRELVWGLIPSWSSEAKAFINARAETLEAKPSFNESFYKRRCLIPADGFFEWKQVGRAKQPHYFQLQDESLFAFAGIWDTWSDGRQSVTSCAIITTAPNEMVAELHDRMPVILLPEMYSEWLNLRTPHAALKELLMPIAAKRMKMHPVSSAVNSPDNDFVSLVDQVDAEVGMTPSLF